MALVISRVVMGCIRGRRAGFGLYVGRCQVGMYEVSMGANVLVLHRL